MRAVLASANAHKLEELSAALPGWRLELLAATEYPPEDGATYRENARVKAAFARSLHPRSWVLGEDSGIEVAALAWGPGIRSARWAADPVERLLAELDGVDDRRARYVCELVALGPDGDELAARGTLDGRIAREARGEEGFGYDPVFVPEGEERTVAELGDAWKRGSSHRARAAAVLAAALRAQG